MALAHLKAKKPEKYNGILNAAVKVFAKKGFYHARVSEIAREAGVADGTIYLYFQNKDDILISLFEEGMSRVIEMVRAEIEQVNDPLEKIRRFARAHMSMLEQDQALAEILQVELRQSSKFMKEYHNEKFFEYIDMISVIIKEGQAQGVIREDVHPGVFKRAFFGALDEMSRFWVLSSKRKYSIEMAAEQIAGYFIKGIAA